MPLEVKRAALWTHSAHQWTWHRCFSLALCSPASAWPVTHMADSTGAKGLKRPVADSDEAEWIPIGALRNALGEKHCSDLDYRRSTDGLLCRVSTEMHEQLQGRKRQKATLFNALSNNDNEKMTGESLLS
ncbi:hypothetical protein MHYP_G00304110 [Metynnis hypsauchen]